MTKTFIFLIPSLLLADVNLTGPIAGYVSPSSRVELRAISGVPGAYLFSDPIALPDGVTGIHLAPGQDFALIERGTAGLAILQLGGGAVTGMTPAAGAMASADWAAFSPTAAAAVLYSSASARLQVLTGLPGSPRVTLDMDAGTLPELPLRAAVSDDASLLLVASGNSVYRVPGSGPAQLVLAAGQILSLALLPNGTDAVVADRSTASIHLLRNAGSVPADRVLASDIPGIGKAYPAADGASVFVAQPGIKAVSSVDVATGNVQTVSSNTAPGQLIPLRNRDTFLISAQPGQPGSVFFRDSDGGHVVFIPAVSTPAVQSGTAQ